MPLSDLPIIAQARYNVTLSWYLDRTDWAEFVLGSSCFSVNPSGFKVVTIVLLVVAIVVEVVEAVLGWNYWGKRSEGKGLMAVGSVVDATCILAVIVVLVWALGGVGDDVGVARSFILGLILLVAWVSSGVAPVIALAAPVCPRISADWLANLDTFGNMLVWLVTALVELWVTAYVIWRQPDNFEGDTWGVLGSEFAGLIVAEVVRLGLVWTARILWTRAKRLLPLKGGRSTDQDPPELAQPVASPIP